MHIPYSILALALTSLAHDHLSRRAGGVTILESIEDVEDEYDFVIAGGGTSGLTVADRLSESGAYTILVLEHGEFDDSYEVYEIRGGTSGFQPPRLFELLTEPIPGLADRQFTVNVGKMVGGSSAVNGMVFARASAEDYDRWGQLWGEEGHQAGWNWEGLLYYFQKAVEFSPPPEEAEDEYQIGYNLASYISEDPPSVEGYIKAGWPSWQFPGSTLLVNAFRDRGLSYINGDCADGHTGTAWFPNTMDQTNVSRSFAKTGHLDQLIDRPNYNILAGAHVDTVNFSLNGTRATGVNFHPTSGGDGKLVKARKEVILAAGPLHTPLILQRSGVGPSNLLEEAGIDVRVELPGVGSNFQDHPDIFISQIEFDTSLPITTATTAENETFISWANLLWETNKTGPWTNGRGNAAAWLPLRDISLSWSDIIEQHSSQDSASFLPPDTHPDILAGYAAQHELYTASLASPDCTIFQHYLAGGFSPGAFITFLQQTSRGFVSINTTSPSSDPVISYRSFSNPTDKLIFTAMIRFIVDFYTANYIPGVNATSSLVGMTDDEIWEYASQNANPSEAHQSSTCSMLPRGLGGVVDLGLNVHGTEGLRIVDASIMPVSPGVALVESVYAVAEKAADLILQDYV